MAWLLTTEPSQAISLVDKVFVVEIKSELPLSKSVGVRKAGMICLPSGTVTWRDVAPDAKSTAVAIEQVLNAKVPEAGDGATTSAPPTQSRFVLTGRIVGAKVDLCMPQWGAGKLLSHRRTLKGSGSLEVVWSVYDQAKKATFLDRSTERRFTFREDDVTASDILQRQVVEAAGEIGALLDQAAKPH